jgi:hypothetical protein
MISLRMKAFKRRASSLSSRNSRGTVGTLHNNMVGCSRRLRAAAGLWSGS